jgi:hypothetical protein
MKRPGFYGNKAPTKTQQRTALRSLLCMRRTLDGVDEASLSRSYGLPVEEVRQAVREEAARRRARA